MSKRLTVLFLSLVAFAAGGPSVSAQTVDQAVIQKMEERNPSLRSFQAHVHVDVRMLNFPFYSPKLDGTSYFKRPNNYEVVFERVPPFAHGFDHFFSDLGDPSSWERRFNIAVNENDQLAGHRMISLHLVAKVRGMIDHQMVYVDPATYEVSQMEWHYYNGGVIVMTQNYRTEGAYTVLSSAHATINIPHVRAVADAQYTDYRTNVALQDSIFSGTH